MQTKNSEAPFAWSVRSSHPYFIYVSTNVSYSAESNVKVLSCVALVLTTSAVQTSCTNDATYLKTERKRVLYIIVIGFTILEE
jgi:hypothetical protein